MLEHNNSLLKYIYIYICLIGVQILYNVLVFTIQQSESVVCLNIPLPLDCLPHHHPTYLGYHRALSWAPYRFPFAIYFTYGSIYMSSLVSQFITLPLTPPHVHVSILYICVSIPALQIVHLYHFSRFHIYALIYICFSVSDWLHSVWQTLSSFLSLQMIQNHCFLWLSNIP